MTRAVVRAVVPALAPFRAVLPSPGTRSHHVWRLVAALAAVYLVWGSTYLATKIAVTSIPPFTLLAVRFALAGGMLFVWAVRRGDREGDRVTLRRLGSAIVTGGMLIVFGTGAMTLAISALPTGTAALLGATVPLWLALIARVGFGERLSPRAWIGLLVGLGGIGLLVEPSGGGDHGAMLLILFGSFAWAAGSLRSRTADAPRRPMVAASLEMIGAAVSFAVVALVRGEPATVRLAEVDGRALLALAYLVVAGSIVAFTAYAWLLRNASTQLVSTYAYINPVVAIGLGWAIAGEVVTGRMLVAGAIVLTSVVLLITGRPGEPVPAQVTSGADVFAGVPRWHRIRKRLGQLPQRARLFVDPGVRQYRRVGSEPAPGDEPAGDRPW